MQYLKGEKNKVADCLSRYFANDKPDERHDISAYVNADARLDPDGEDLTIARAAELYSHSRWTYPSVPKAKNRSKITSNKGTWKRNS
jgi:hypothetical protein